MEVPRTDVSSQGVDDIISAYRRSLVAAASPLVGTPDRWEQARDQAREVLLECAAPLSFRVVPISPESRERAKEIGASWALQGIPISDSIRAADILWKAAMPRLRYAALAPSGMATIDSAVKLMQCVETLQNSISVRLSIAAAAHHETLMVKRLMARAEAGAPARQSERVDRLTGRERQVLELLAAGRSNREISRQLQIAENTVKRHVRGILDKFGVRSRLEAVVLTQLYHA